MERVSIGPLGSCFRTIPPGDKISVVYICLSRLKLNPRVKSAPRCPTSTSWEYHENLCIRCVLSTYFFQYFRNIFGRHGSVILTKHHNLSVFFGHRSSLLLHWWRLKYMFLQVFGHHICVILTKYHKLCICFGYHGSLILPRRRPKYLHVFSNIFRNHSSAI